MHEIGRIFRTYCSEKHTKWAIYIQFVQECLNYTVHQSTGFARYHLHFDENPRERIIDLFPRLKKKKKNKT